ncbi:hypothetical protein LIX60_12745 [Streptomyces sp. S07_1.15]|uniref:hypothetical protein n=1 Tax=Streptomyces sp. S07_1.15 TaxID=2873925 RepID=UPI001D155276|nr:hypothetical protein [Streptomyces sp. S07_1.15]MCC3652323.1 hypothetical protein [Streptomyces sp. S07_1.15]
MARSTIQDKLSGKSRINLPEVLSIVEALAEHARLSGAPLLPQEIDPGVWRERLSNFDNALPRRPSTPHAPAASMKQQEPWNIEALELAQMHDIVEIVRNSNQMPTASWLPNAVESMLLAEMSVSEFMKRAAKDRPQEIIQTLVALDRSFPAPEPTPWPSWNSSDHDKTVGALLAHTARVHGTRSTPAIVVAMRRAQISEHVDSYLVAIARMHSARNIRHIVQQLRVATLQSDADRVLEFTGSKRQTGRILEVVLEFRASGKFDDASRILRGVGAGGWYLTKAAVDEIGGHELAEEFVRDILRGIPYGKHSEYAEQISEYGNEVLSQRILRAADEPPF